MRILGVDPGLATVGIGIVDTNDYQNFSAVEWCTIQSKTGQPFADRLLELTRDLEEIIRTYSPELAVVEKLFFAVNEKTAIDVAQARGALITQIAKSGIEIMEATPLQLKSTITGDGSADKRQMQEMLKRMLKLDAIPEPDDAADALGLAIYGALQARTVAL